MKRKLKNSVGISAFGPAATRFDPAGYHTELSNETMEAYIAWHLEQSFK